MLRTIDDLPENVLGFEAVGEVTADDYGSVLVPALEAMLASQPKARLLYVLGPEFDKFSGGAAWRDATVGMRHFTDFERVAVVTDKDWIENMVEAFGFVMPGDVETFDFDELNEARAWIAETKPKGELEYKMDEVAGVLTLIPHDDLGVADFANVGEVVDAQIEKAGRLNGIVIVADEFPGWDSLSAMTSHFRFVRNHHKSIGRVAFVTDDRFLSAVPRLAKHFVAAEIQRFEPGATEEAQRWAAGTMSA
jgi:hypothetical protein